MEGTKKTRINKYDNLKGLAMLLIIFGHLDYLHTLKAFGIRTLFFFDLPIFFFVAGYFSKTTPDQPLKSFKRLMIPYFIYCLLIELFRLFYIGSMNWSMIFIKASVGLWFLIALFIMKMILPILDKFRFPVITTLLFAMLFGLFDIHPNILGLTRLFAYLPIFIAGFKLNEYKKKLVELYPKVYDFYDRHFNIILILVIIATIIVLSKFTARFFIFKSPYRGRIEFEAIKRLIVIVLEIVWMVILNRIMTNREFFLTQIGRNSMTVYVLHLFLVIFLNRIWTNVITSPTLSFALTLTATLAIAYVLSRDIVTKYFNMLNDAVFNFFVKPDSI